MAAGLGFIEFSTGDVLSAAAANGYLASQTVMVFASAAARTSAITSPQEGMFSFLKDTNATQFYDGAAWVNLDTTGMVNPMTTTGDTIYSSSGTTPARLGIGTAGQVLTVNSGANAPQWSTPANGGLTLITAQTIGTAVSSIAVTSVFSSTYDNYKIMISGGTSSANNVLYLQLGSTVTGYYAGYTRVNYGTGAASLVSDNNGTNFTRIGASNTNGIHSNFDILAPNLAKNTFVGGFFIDNATASSGGSFGGFLNDTTAYTGFTILMNTGNLTGGTIRVYGYKNS